MQVSLRTLRNRIKREPVIREILSGRFLGGIYLVGGAIRELCLGGKPNDYDLVLSEPQDLTALEALLGATAFVLGKKPIQTYRIVTEALSVDVTYLQGTIEVDLLRRDFTMNAIAYDILADQLIDTLGGVADIEKGIIRYPSSNTLSDDPLRMLKAVRHFSVMTGFRLSDELEEAITQWRHSISMVAAERIKYEMDLTIGSENAYAGLKIMESTGLLFEIFPELSSLRQLDIEKGFILETYGHTIEGFKYLRRFGGLFGLDEKAIRNVGYALLFHDLGKAYTFSYDEQKNLVHFFHHERVSTEMATPIMERLRFSTHEMKAINRLIENHMRIFLISGAESTEKAIRRLVYKMEQLTPSLIVLTLCDLYGSSGGTENASTIRIKEKCNEITQMHDEWKKEPLPKLINGHDLIDLGFAEGPEIGKVLAEIREKQLSGEIMEEEAALNYVRASLKAS